MVIKIGDRISLSKAALRAALKIRAENNFKPTQAVDVFTLVTNLGIDVNFVDIPTLEGMYMQSPRPRILISSHRPLGRQTFNCGHEFGHHVFKHGTTIDELISGRDEHHDPKEFLVDQFSSFLLMPKSLVNNAFLSRGWNPSQASALQIYTIASWLGVGYTTLVYQMTTNLGFVNRNQQKALLSIHPKGIKNDLLGFDSNSHLIIMDKHWDSNSIEIQVGDLILVQEPCIKEGTTIEQVPVDTERTLFKGVKPGISRITKDEARFGIFVKVSRRGYVGRNIFRHEVDSEHSDS
jgi:Zn-dependent peptidase ImmA (M78 family)